MSLQSPGSNLNTCDPAMVTARFSFKSQWRHFFAKLCNTITRQAVKLERCSNPLRIQVGTSFSFDFKKCLFIFGLGFSVKSYWGHVFTFFAKFT